MNCDRSHHPPSSLPSSSILIGMARTSALLLLLLPLALVLCAFILNRQSAPGASPILESLFPMTEGYFGNPGDGEVAARPDVRRQIKSANFYQDQWHKQPKLQSAGSWDGSQGFHTTTREIIDGMQGVAKSMVRGGRQSDVSIINAGISDSFDGPPPPPPLAAALPDGQGHVADDTHVYG